MGDLPPAGSGGLNEPLSSLPIRITSPSAKTKQTYFPVSSTQRSATAPSAGAAVPVSAPSKAIVPPAVSVTAGDAPPRRASASAFTGVATPSAAQ